MLRNLGEKLLTKGIYIGINRSVFLKRLHF